MKDSDLTQSDPSYTLGQGYYTIPAGRPFAMSLAQGVIHAFGRSQDLSKVQIFLPSRRAVQAQKAAFIECADGHALFLPKLAPIGDIDEDASDIINLSFQDSSADLLSLPASISPIEKQLILTRLIERMPLAGQAVSASQAVHLARALSQLLDQIYQAESLPDALYDQVPQELAAHWQDILKFLDIIIKNWPAILGERGLLDPVLRKMKLVDQQIESWRTCPPDHPVILAGSTGSLPKTLHMMRAVAKLPCGMVVFPGLDNRLCSDTERQAICEDTAHPFHQLLTTLNHLKIDLEEVRSWPAGQLSAEDELSRKLRTDFLMQVFKPAPLSHEWRRIREDNPELDKRAISGLCLYTADTLHQEADIIAGLMRKTLEKPGKTAMLVTPDRKLARQVRAALLKWDLDIEDSAGIDLIDSPAGSFLALISEWFASKGTAKSLLALLKHPLASAGLPFARCSALVRTLELGVLRGYLADSSYQGIAERLTSRDGTAEMRAFYHDHILTALGPLIELFDVPNLSLAMLADAHGIAAEKLAQTDIENEGVLKLWETPDGKMAANLLAQLAESGVENSVKPSEYALVFRAVCSGHVVRKIWRSHPRLEILGTVEARMQKADLIILGGLNEGVWPPSAQADPWMNQHIRQALNLPDKQWRSGLSAHDFFMLASYSEVVITRAMRADDAPTSASRWLERMQAVLHAAALNEEAATSLPDDIAALLTQHRGLAVQPAPMPRPCPPASARPLAYSATDFAMLISDPYQLYARKILALRPVDPVDRQPDNALKGTLIHQLFSEFIERHPEGELPVNAHAELCQQAAELFAPYQAYPPVRLFWQEKFNVIARWFCQFENSRRAQLVKSYTEINAKKSVSTQAGEVEIKARADRLDIDIEGKAQIIDYKTGSVPSKQAVEQGRAPQLLVEAALFAQGGFDIDYTLVTGELLPQLCYWQMAGHYGREAEIKEVTPKNLDTEALFQALTELIVRYSQSDTPFLSEPDPASRMRFSDYRHLARVREWRPQEVDSD